MIINVIISYLYNVSYITIYGITLPIYCIYLTIEYI